MKAGAVGLKVAGALSSLIPKATNVVYAGTPSHHNYINIGGTAFNPWYEKGARIKNSPLYLPFPTMYKGPKKLSAAGMFCDNAARKRDLRWSGKKPVVGNLPKTGSDFNAIVTCEMTLPEAYRTWPIRVKKGASAKEIQSQCTTTVGKRGYLFTGIILPLDPLKNTWNCQIRG